jgi:predicted nuclease of restriction endonuclease-like (RecB) superfamily
MDRNLADAVTILSSSTCVRRARTAQDPRVNQNLPTDYAHLLTEIKGRVRAAQLHALRAVNRELVRLYWDIGKLISARQKGETWGRSVIPQLAEDLQTEFPGVNGFSSRNLWNMRNLFVSYSQHPKLQPLVAEIGWTQNVVILDRCKDPLQREFYLLMTRRMGWTKNVLIHQIENQTFERTVRSQSNFEQTLPGEATAEARLAIKDEYTFDFLDLSELHSERELERALVGRVEAFLREMGGMFAFIASQQRLEVGNEVFFLDLLLYHRGLRALVAVELKIGRFQPEHVGKMQFYLAVLDETLRLPGENDPIGIILCKDKNKTIVEYALRDSANPIGIARYRMVTSLPVELEGQLPAPEQIASLLDDVR